MSTGDTQEVTAPVLRITPTRGGAWSSTTAPADEMWSDAEPTADYTHEGDLIPALRLEVTVGPEGARSVAVVAALGGEMDGWMIRAHLASAADGPEFDEVILRQGPRGATIGSRKLRSMGLGDVVDALTRMLEDVRAPVYLGPEWAKPLRRPGRRRTDPRAYAVVAARYVHALKVSPRAPYRAMVEEAAARGEYETEVALRARVRRARKLPDPVLTPAVPGRPGGELTEYGKQLAREMGEEVD